MCLAKTRRYRHRSGLWKRGGSATTHSHWRNTVHKNLHSNILNSNRDVIVYLPPGYEASTSARYSVFYMHDGQNIFDGATSFIPGQDWRVDETAQSLISAGKIEPLIIVGISNTGPIE